MRITSATRATWRVTLLAIAVLLAAVSLTACAPAPGTDHPAARTVERLLELRAERSTDGAAYAAVVADSEVASALVEAARLASSTVAPTPDWEAPYVSNVSSSTAEVVVVWRASSAHADWSAATVFAAVRRGDGWAVTDAREATSGAIPKPLASP
jgi:hypothetical protein